MIFVKIQWSKWRLAHTKENRFCLGIVGEVIWKNHTDCDVINSKGEIKTFARINLLVNLEGIYIVGLMYLDKHSIL